MRKLLRAGFSFFMTCAAACSNGDTNVLLLDSGVEMDGSISPAPDASADGSSAQDAASEDAEAGASADAAVPPKPADFLGRWIAFTTGDVSADGPSPLHVVKVGESGSSGLFKVAMVDGWNWLLTRDGRWLTFESASSMFFVSLQGPRPGAPIPLEGGPVSWTQLEDGKRLVGLREPAGGPPQLVFVDLAGTSPIVVHEATLPTGDYYASWSPAEQRAVLWGRDIETAQELDLPEGLPDVILLPAISGSDAAWIDEKRLVVVERALGKARLTYVDTTTTPVQIQTELLPAAEVIHSWALSRDGSRVAYISGDEYVGRMVAYAELNGAESFKFKFVAAESGDYPGLRTLAWSHDNALFFLQQDTLRKATFDAEAPELSELPCDPPLSGSWGWADELVVSPGGRWLALAHVTGESWYAFYADLYLADLSVDDPVGKLVADGGDNWGVNLFSFSQDDDWLIFEQSNLSSQWQHVYLATEPPTLTRWTHALTGSPEASTQEWMSRDRRAAVVAEDNGASGCGPLWHFRLDAKGRPISHQEVYGCRSGGVDVAEELTDSR